MGPWRIVLFLCAMAAPGECLKCVTCSSISDSCFFSTIKNCPVGQVCASQYSATISGAAIFQSFDRLCAAQSECNVTGTFTHYSTTEKIATTCCSTDLCTPKKPKLPTMNSDLNGVVCPQCNSLYSCGSNQNIRCTGDQRMCLLVSRQSTLGNDADQKTHTVTHGCASSGYCSKNTLTSTVGEVYTKTTYQCSKGTVSDGTSTSAPQGTKMGLLMAFHCLWLSIFTFY